MLDDAVGGQEGALGHHVEPGEDRQPLVIDKLHDAALSFYADEREGEQASLRLLARNHLRAGKPRLLNSDGPEELYSEVFVNVELKRNVLEFNEKDPEYRGPLVKSLSK
jgi:hypothetical protein